MSIAGPQAARAVAKTHTALGAFPMTNIPMTRQEEALAVHDTNHFRSSTFVQLEDGQVLHASGPEFTTSRDRGVTWSEPYGLRARNGEAVGGIGLVRLAGNGIGLVERRRKASSVFWRSEDGGKTWDAPVSVTQLLRDLGILAGESADGRGVAVTKNHVVVPRGEWPDTVLAEGDRIDVLQAAAGG